MTMIGRILRGALHPIPPLGMYQASRREDRRREDRRADQRTRQQQEEARQTAARQEEKQRREDFAKEPYRELESFQRRQEDVASQFRNQAQQARQEAKQEAQEAFSSPPPGLAPEQRRAMEESAARQIGGATQNYIRQIAGRMGSRGVRGGATAAVQQDIARQGQDSLGEFQRRLSGLDAEQSMRKLAAQFALQEGGAAQSTLDRQAAADLILGYLQNQTQRELARRADDFYYTI